MKDDQDSMLVVRCQLGDRAAWETLVHRWHPRLWRFIFGMLGNHAVSEDVLQNVWLRIVRSLVRLREPDRLSAWMYGVARNVIADRLREQYRRPEPKEFTDAIVESDASEILEITDSLKQALDCLHPANREVVVLYYLEEKSLDEVAAVCLIPPGTVKSRLHRSRRLLREKLEREK